MRRWQRFGFDRLYGTADGASVGWVDLDTRERRIESPELAEVFEHAVEAWRNQHLMATGPPGGSRPSGPSDRAPRLGVKEKPASARRSDATQIRAAHVPRGRRLALAGMTIFKWPCFWR